jgi:hypothetical protein
MSLKNERFYGTLTVATNNKTYLGLEVNCPILSKFGVSRQIFIESLTPPPPNSVPNFTENSQMGAALTHAHSRTDRRTDIMCLTGAFLRLCPRAYEAAVIIIIIYCN